MYPKNLDDVVLAVTFQMSNVPDRFEYLLSSQIAEKFKPSVGSAGVLWSLRRLADRGYLRIEDYEQEGIRGLKHVSYITAEGVDYLQKLTNDMMSNVISVLLDKMTPLDALKA